ncbi:MAG: carbohydrate ABC transporter permease [Actinobacteria bacterium]|nr:carbohydrate ABC transporter permease [Actinomycetota bacterium]NBO47167.1 carbohydrate ABC transporter permease [Actinomycetota bacterium]NBP42712.1 carbohydrate ABC transporter permease [Actinomycetota bacterium]NBQ00738.1 carbohydrate ABC transporter permease [Actinomycetota bacterium]NBQ66722.1 carbohydrate ABC transporter permease [Actinomycetota bacterium]
MSRSLNFKPSNDRATKITLTFACWTTAILFFLPIAWIIATALKPKNTVLDIPPKVFFVPTLQNLIDALSFSNTLSYFINSIIYSSIAVLLAILVSFLAAYSFSRFKPAGTDFLMFLLLSTRFVPAAAFVIPFFQLFNILKLKDSFLGLIIFYTMFSIPFSVWILKGFIDGVSTKFDETGLVYGAKRPHIMFKLVLPQVRSGLVAAFVFNIIFVWNEFLFNFQLGGLKTYGIPVGLFTSITKGGQVDWSFVASIGTLYVLPLALVIYFFQRYLLVGLTFGTVRGEV